MERKKLFKYYCNTDGWVTSSPCLVCGKDAKETVLPARRGNMYYLKDIDHPLPSVTSILQVLAKPALIYWAAKTASSYAFENPSASVEEAASSINRVKKGAGKRGTDVHDLILREEFDEVPKEYRGYMDAYLKFKTAMPHKVVMQEKIVYSDSYAGKFDAYVDMGGKFWLLDYKTNNSGLYPETGLQLSAYSMALQIEDRPGEKGQPWDNPVDGLLGVHLKPDGTFSTKEYKNDFKVFEACLKIYHWNE